jgi:Phosphopantetheine attachment site
VEQMELLPAVLEIVGVPVGSVKDTDTLASLGMDSLQLSEVNISCLSPQKPFGKGKVSQVLGL